jgi:hypothetical protein
MPHNTKDAESDVIKAVVAKSLADLADELRPLETAADNLGSVATALDYLADATALRVIADHGSAEDRERALEILKGRFDAFRGY